MNAARKGTGMGGYGWVGYGSRPVLVKRGRLEVLPRVLAQRREGTTPSFLRGRFPTSPVEVPMIRLHQKRTRAYGVEIIVTTLSVSLTKQEEVGGLRHSSKPIKEVIAGDKCDKALQSRAT